MPTPSWIRRLDWGLIRGKAEKFRLEPEFLAALIQTESAGNPWALRYEPTYRWIHDIRALATAVGCSYDTMESMQRHSWGLCQVMGGVLYERGLADEPYPEDMWCTAALDPVLNVEYGCRHIRVKADRYGDNPSTLYAAYNAGSPRKEENGMFRNQRNVDRFDLHYRELTQIG